MIVSSGEDDTKGERRGRRRKEERNDVADTKGFDYSKQDASGKGKAAVRSSESTDLWTCGRGEPVSKNVPRDEVFVAWEASSHR